jgi:uncharacterized membrane protein
MITKHNVITIWSNVMLLGLLLVTQISVVGQTAGSNQQPDKNSTEPRKAFNKALGEAQNEFEKGKEKHTEPDVSVLPGAPNLNDLDGPTKESYYVALRAYYQYRTSGYEHRRTLFRWQFISSIIIFVVVILLVFLGMYFSWVQFRNSLSSRAADRSIKTKRVVVENQKNSNPEKLEGDVLQSRGIPDPIGPTSVTTLKASREGIEVSSPVLGVIILIISFLFFYLYLKTVYPINNVF